MAVNREVGLNVRKVTLDKLPVAVSLRLREEYPAVANSMRMEKFYHHDIPEYVTYTFISFLLHIHKQDKVETTLYKYPSTLWEFFKDKYAPKWMLKRWPVQYETKKIATCVEKNFMCPHLSAEGSDPHVYWMMEANDPLYIK